MQQMLFSDLMNASNEFGAHQLFEDAQNLKYNFFKMTPKISTYLYVIIAGPYKSVEQNLEQYPPMKLFMRDSLMKKVN